MYKGLRPLWHVSFPILFPFSSRHATEETKEQIPPENSRRPGIGSRAIWYSRYQRRKKEAKTPSYTTLSTIVNRTAYEDALVSTLHSLNHIPPMIESRYASYRTYTLGRMDYEDIYLSISFFILPSRRVCMAL